jgi:DNA repair protein RecO (recombination protein O)
MTAERHYRDQAVVLHGRQLGEADRIISLYTLENGKVDAVAKAIRKPRSKLAGRLELASEVRVELHRGRKLDVITDAELIHPHWQHLLEPETFAIATTVLELMATFCEHGDPNPELYRLLTGMLTALGTFPDPAGLLPRFELRLLSVLGFGPECEICVQCGSSLEGSDAWVDLEGGGLACQACRAGVSGVRVLQALDVALMAALGRANGTGRRVVLRATPEVTIAAHAFLLHHLGRRPRSETAAAALLAIRPLP